MPLVDLRVPSPVLHIMACHFRSVIRGSDVPPEVAALAKRVVESYAALTADLDAEGGAGSSSSSSGAGKSKSAGLH